MTGLKKIKDIVVYKDENYNSFPNAIKMEDGTIMVGFRQAPDWQGRYNDVTHGDPSSIGVFVKSHDNGKTWDKKASLIQRHFYYGIQDPCLNYLSDGTILATFFMWKFTEKDKPVTDSAKPHFVNDNYDMEMMDAHTIRSNDGGLTWDEALCIEYEGKNGDRASARGNVVELDDGSILFGLPMYSQNMNERIIRIIKSFDKGKTWTKLNDIKKPYKCVMGEPNLFKTKSGKIACFIRTHIEHSNRNVYDDGNQDLSPMHISYSYDDGKNWTVPVSTRFCSPSPFQAIQLDSGNVLLSYGHRYTPYGINVVLLDGELDNIDSAEEFQVRDDGVNHDLGYTSSVQLDNGDILVTYYIFHKDDTRRYIGGTLLKEIN
ncbi:MAG: exo-alpha-sialidase [Clostridia bacterium]|nr:exo-alpha-sialidase [Clostridia bacterium]MBN2882088.1 exo-alpha-sialidase [Clostridia bacterium]